MALHKHCSLHTFLIRASHGAGDLRPKLPLRLGLALQLGLRLGFREHKALRSKDTGAGKACQAEHSTAPTLLPPHLSNPGHPQCWGPQPQPQAAIRVRVCMERPSKPTAPGTLQLFTSQSEQRACVWRTLCVYVLDENLFFFSETSCLALY